MFALTRDGFQWKTIPLKTEALEQKVAAFRRGLDVDVLLRRDWRGLFDLARAHELYDALIDPVEPLISDKRHLMVVPTSALTALPFHLLVTEKPTVTVPPIKTVRDLAAYRDAAWLLKRHAVSVLPSVASLKALRVFGSKGQAAKPLVGFGDPIFNPEENQPDAKEKIAVAARSYPEFWKGLEIDRGMLRGLPRPAPRQRTSSKRSPPSLAGFDAVGSVLSLSVVSRRTHQPHICLPLTTLHRPAGGLVGEPSGANRRRHGAVHSVAERRVLAQRNPADDRLSELPSCNERAVPTRS